MNSTSTTTEADLMGWLREQVKQVNTSMQELENSHNYGKLAICEGMREAYLQCLKRLEAA